MSETKAHTQQHRPVDTTSPFFTVQHFWKGEMMKFMDEASHAMERSCGEMERMSQESSRMGVAGMRALHEATRQWMSAARTMLG